MTLLLLALALLLPLAPPADRVVCALSLGGEPQVVRAYPAIFDDFVYPEARWGRGIFGANPWALCGSTRRQRAWYRFSVGAGQNHWNPRGRILADPSGTGTVSLLLPRGYTGNSTWRDNLSFNPSIQLNVPVTTGTYAARIRFSPLARGASVNQAFFTFNDDTRAELDFEWTNAPNFCGGQPICEEGLLFVTNHDGGAQEGALPMFCSGDDPCREAFTEDYVVLLMDYRRDGVEYTAYRLRPGRAPLRWGPRTLRAIVPTDPMLIWIGNGIMSEATRTITRDHRMDVDWVYHTPVNGLSLDAVLAEVEGFRGRGLHRVNTLSAAR